MKDKNLETHFKYTHKCSTFCI